MLVPGNRGKCAQPCRLPYELVESCFQHNLSNSDKTLDKGYLLSTKDLCSLELLPTLVKLGIKCFKIEGRLKSPEYVATVTRIYRKYIDLALQDNVPYVIDEQDKKDLLQVFNRGGFSNGYLNNAPHYNLIYKNKPNNMGIFLGTVLNFNSNKGYITLKLENSISIGDSVSLENERGSYTISELITNNTNIPSAEKGKIVKIGRIKGGILNGDKIFKIGSKELNNNVANLVNSENIKNIINCKIAVHSNLPVSMKIYTNTCDYGNKNWNSIYNNIDFTIISDLIPTCAINSPITKERIIDQINKITNTPYSFGKIEVDLEDGLYIPSISKLNQLRRDAIRNLEEILFNRIHRNTNDNESLKINKANQAITLNQLSQSIQSIQLNQPNQARLKKISILLNIINKSYNYTELKNIDKIYIPLHYFTINSENYNYILTDICNNYNTYIYMPSVLKNLQVDNINKILKMFNIKGLVLSNISHFSLFNNCEIIANYNLNIFNNFTVLTLAKLHASSITISPELDISAVNNICNICNNSKINSEVNSEVIVYGNLPIMTTNYCIISRSNFCLKKCNSNCLNLNKKYYLKDRLNFKFRLLPDPFSGTTTIFNTKTLSIPSYNLSCNSIRLDFIDETVEDINKIVELASSGNFLQGKDYTNWNYNRVV